MTFQVLTHGSAPDSPISLDLTLKTRGRLWYVCFRLLSSCKDLIVFFSKFPMGRDLSQVGAFAHTVQLLLTNEQFKGEEYTDDVTIDSLTISGQSIGVAQSVGCVLCYTTNLFTCLAPTSRLELMELMAFSGRSLISTPNLSYPIRNSRLGPIGLTQGTYHLSFCLIQVVERAV